jgi:hypothetical protein
MYVGESERQVRAMVVSCWFYALVVVQSIEETRLHLSCAFFAALSKRVVW